MDVFAFGEILWDVYPGEKFLGGAPFNFAAHLSHLGNKVFLITAIGNDQLGNEAMKSIIKLNLDNKFVSVFDYPTGICQVTNSNDGIPKYDLCTHRAYDYIELNNEQYKKIKSVSDKMLYFGSLAQRNECSRKTIKKLISEYNWNEILFDINIRQNYYTKEVIEDSLEACTILKISQEEFPVFADLCICDFDLSDSSNFEKACRFLSHTYDIETIILTLGKDGAMVYVKNTDKGMFSKQPKNKVVSTVGAGDSFYAAYVNALIKGKSVKEALDNAIELSQFVVSHIEAVPEYTKELLEILK